MTSLSRRTPRQALLAGASAAAIALGGALAGAAPASAQQAVPGASAAAAPHASAADDPQYPNLAPTPPMGWNNWSYYGCSIDEKTVLDNAKALVSSGLAAKGYTTVTIDDCWMSHDRAADGSLTANPKTFPHGMAYIGEQLHKLGLRFGIYEDAGTKTCGGYPGSYGHISQDMDLFASWKIDYLKLDGCNVPVASGQSDEQAYHDVYAETSRALLATGRPIVFSISAPAYFEDGPDWDKVIGWSARLGNLWRQGADIAMEPASARSKWSSILWNYRHNAKLADLQSPGRWNDPDFLVAGQSNLTGTEIRSQAALWAVMAAPMISSTDLTKLSADARAVLGNKDVIAVDQDRAGVQGRITGHGDGWDVLAKPLADGDRAVALFNPSDEARTITTTAAESGFPSGKSFLLKDLETKRTTQSAGTFSANVPAHGTVLYRVHPGAGHAVPPSTAITWKRTGGEGTGSTWTVSLANHGSTPVKDVSLAVRAPDGWKTTPSSAHLPDLGTDDSASVDVHVNGPAGKPGTTVTGLTATASYVAPGGGGRTSVSGRGDVVTTVPYPDLTSAFNNVGVTDDAAPPAAGNYTLGNFDGGGDSYSAPALAAAGVTPGSPIAKDGVTWTFPDVARGEPDNVATAGQDITMGGSGSELWFLGAEAGFTQGTVTVHYTDGSTSTGSLGFPNWCCTAGDEYGAVTVAATDHRNTGSGPANFGTQYKLFGNKIALDAGKTVASVTLPDEDAIHVFGITVK